MITSLNLKKSLRLNDASAAAQTKSAMLMKPTIASFLFLFASLISRTGAKFESAFKL